MSELDFALDGLYAAGWWPSEGDHCLQAADNRWYPSQSMVLAYFRQSGIDLRQAACSPGRPISLSWEMPGCGWETVTAKSHTVAHLLAFTHLYQSAHRCTRQTTGA